MRMLHVLLVAFVGLLASSEAVSTGRHLRTAVRVDADEEERAVAKFTGTFIDKADMDKWLMTWLNKKKSVDSVSKKLGVYNKAQDAAKLNPNWEALLKYTAMKKVFKEGSAYARFGTELKTKQQAQEDMMKWIMNGYSVKSVAKTLGVSGLSRKELISHENYNAFKFFLTGRKQWARMVATNFQSMT